MKYRALVYQFVFLKIFSKTQIIEVSKKSLKIVNFLGRYMKNYLSMINFFELSRLVSFLLLLCKKSPAERFDSGLGNFGFWSRFLCFKQKNWIGLGEIWSIWLINIFIQANSSNFFSRFSSQYYLYLKITKKILLYIFSSRPTFSW